MCESFEKCEKLIVSVDSVPRNQWTHITFSGSPSAGSFLALESNTGSTNVIDQKTYVIMR